MSQVAASEKSRLAQRLERPKARAESLLRSFEWDWTRAIVFSIGLTFFLMITTSVIPSFWLYFADQQLKWDGSGPNGFWLLKLRDAIAAGLVTLPIIVVLVGAAIMQNWRRKLRGQSGDVRPTGGYR
jgi:hypothetical protein